MCHAYGCHACGCHGYSCYAQFVLLFQWARYEAPRYASVTPYPPWAVALGWLMSLSSVLWIPIVALQQVCTEPDGNLREVSDWLWLSGCLLFIGYSSVSKTQLLCQIWHQLSKLSFSQSSFHTPPFLGHATQKLIRSFRNGSGQSEMGQVTVHRSGHSETIFVNFQSDQHFCEITIYNRISAAFILTKTSKHNY